MFLVMLETQYFSYYYLHHLLIWTNHFHLVSIQH